MCSFIFGNPLGRTSMSPLFQGANHREGIRWSLGVWHRKIFVIELEKEPRKRAPDNWRVYPFNAFGQSDVILKIQHTHPFRNPFLFPLYLFISRLLHHHHHWGLTLVKHRVRALKLTTNKKATLHKIKKERKTTSVFSLFPLRILIPSLLLPRIFFKVVP